MQQEDGWNPDITNKDKVKLDDLKFIFSQAEKRLDDTMDTRNSIATKTNTLMGFIVTIILGVAGYIFNTVIKGDYTTFQLIVPVVSVFYLYGIILYLNPNFLPTSYYLTGSRPSKLFVNDFFAKDKSPDIVSQSLYVSEIKDYEIRIVKNTEINDERWKIFRNSTIALIATPLIALGATVFVKLFLLCN